MPGPKIRITIESGTGNNDVSLSEFTRVVRSSNALLNNAARTALGRKHDCGFFLSGLSRNSPVSIEITPVSRTLPAAAQDITGTLREEGDILVRDNGVRLPNSSFGLWRNLALPYMEDRIGELTMESVDGDSVDGIMKMDKRVIESIKKIRKEEIKYRTSIVGRVEVLNLHDSHYLKLYPRVKRWNSVKVYFGENSREDVVECVDKYAEISGEGKRRPGDILPYEMKMDKIRKLPDKEKIPKLSEMRGIAPNITGGKSVQEYMDDIRKEWD